MQEAQLVCPLFGYALVVPRGLEEQALQGLRDAGLSSHRHAIHSPPRSAPGFSWGRAGAYSTFLISHPAPLSEKVLSCCCLDAALALVVAGEVGTVETSEVGLLAHTIQPEAVRSAVRTLQAHRPLRKDATFRVATLRGGDHCFKSVAVSAAIADRIVDDSLPDCPARHWKADMNCPDVLVVCILVQSSLIVGLLLPPFLPHRSRTMPIVPRAYLSREARERPHLAPSRAACLVRLAALEHGETMLDPCGGLGILAIEAALAFPSLTCAISIDVDKVAARHAATHATAAAAAAADGCAPVVIRLEDALATVLESNSIDVVISDLPFGHSHSKLDVGRLLKELWRVLRSGGRMLLVVKEAERAALERSAKRLRFPTGVWQCEGATAFASGGIDVCAVQLRKAGGSLKAP